MLLVASAGYLRPTDDSLDFSWEDHSGEEKKWPKSFKKSIEKGIRCKAGMKDGGKAGKMCEGGMSMNTTVGVEDMMEETTLALHGQLMEMMPSAIDFVPDDDIMETMKLLDVNEGDDNDEALLDKVDDGFSKTIEFGGKAHVDFGCRVTFSKKRGKFTKSVKCGMKGAAGIGKKDKDERYESMFNQE